LTVRPERFSDERCAASSEVLARRQGLAAGDLVEQRDYVRIARDIFDHFFLRFGQERRGIVGGKPFEFL
jgi:hypothetical protein